MVGLQVRGRRVVMQSTLATERYMPVSSKLKHSRCRLKQWQVSVSGNRLRIEPCSRSDRPIRHELQLLRELWRKNKVGMRKAVLVRLAYHVLRPLCRKRIWLFSDRVMRAGDNGEAMFRYVCQHPVKGVKPCFVLHSKSADWAAMKRVGTVIPYDSMRAKLIHLIAECVISSSGDLSVRNPFAERIPYYCDLMPNQRYVFLQHGVTKDDQSAWLNRRNKGIDGFVTSGRPEWEDIAHGANYGYDEAQIWLTGMPRYDLLRRDSKRWVTIMPTWRQYLMTRYDPKNGGWLMDEERFLESGFFCFYAALLKHPRLIAAAREYGYTLQCCLHPNLLPYAHLFGADEAVSMLGEDTPYRTIFAQSDLLVTDYSSTAFDFAWLHQPVIYAQFDAEEFFSGAHVYQKGYFDYERDGFGPVTHDLEGTVDAMIDAMRAGCEMQPEYRRRVDSFFAWQDQNNCQRVYEKLTALNAPK